LQHDGRQPIILFNSGRGLKTSNGILPFIDHRLPLCNIYNFISRYTTLNDLGKLMGLSSYANTNNQVLDFIKPLIKLTFIEASGYRKIINDIREIGKKLSRSLQKKKI
jgi:hypothetical protein